MSQPGVTPSPPPAASPPARIEQCVCCGATTFELREVLWDELVAAWRLSRAEAQYIDRQQGLTCARCGTNLRSMALAAAVMRCYGYRGVFQDFVRTRAFRRLRVLEINPAGTLSGHLARARRTEAFYPRVDMTAMPYRDGAFDLVVHSDTLEHVPDPVRGLRECRRVLDPAGFCCFTIPIVVDRLTLSRAGLPPSYHGKPTDARGDYVVHTEYGCDFWKQVMEAGFRECRIITAEYPAAQAVVAA